MFGLSFQMIFSFLAGVALVSAIWLGLFIRKKMKEEEEMEAKMTAKKKDDDHGEGCHGDGSRQMPRLEGRMRGYPPPGQSPPRRPDWGASRPDWGASRPDWGASRSGGNAYSFEAGTFDFDTGMHHHDRVPPRSSDGGLGKRDTSRSGERHGFDAGTTHHDGFPPRGSDVRGHSSDARLGKRGASDERRDSSKKHRGNGSGSLPKSFPKPGRLAYDGHRSTWPMATLYRRYMVIFIWGKAHELYVTKHDTAGDMSQKISFFDIPRMGATRIYPIAYDIVLMSKKEIEAQVKGKILPHEILCKIGDCEKHGSGYSVFRVDGTGADCEDMESTAEHFINENGWQKGCNVKIVSVPKNGNRSPLVYSRRLNFDMQ
jgi:hypothetical protein